MMHAKYLIAVLIMMLSSIQYTYAQTKPDLPPAPAQAVPQSPEQMKLKQFEQWLQQNGYAQNQQNQQNPQDPPDPPPAGVPSQQVQHIPPGVALPNVPGALPTNIPPPPGAPGHPPQFGTTMPTTVPMQNGAAQMEVPSAGVRHGHRMPVVPQSGPLEFNMHPPRNPPPPSHLTYKQNQETMLNSAPPTSVPPSDDAAVAFNNLLQQNMPLAPQQIVQLRQQIDMSQRAAAVPANIPPKPVSTTIMINLAPGTTPPAIRLAQGYVSSLVFVDSTGAPWPIAAFDIGNPKSVNLQWDGKSNVLLIQAVLPYSFGDIVIRLVGLPTPITLELVSGQRVVDYRVDLHVSGIGPLAKELPIGTALPPSANQLLLTVLDGIAPPGSIALPVIGADAQAWLLGERLYLRTRFTVLSPGWVSTMVSPDGMHAYELPRTSSVLISRYGEPAELRIGGL